MYFKIALNLYRGPLQQFLTSQQNDSLDRRNDIIFFNKFELKDNNIIFSRGVVYRHVTT